MTKARTNASATPAVGRNMIINGAMTVAARLGENAFVNSIGASTGYFTVDRWLVAASGTAGRLKMRHAEDGPNGISAKSVKLECTTADTSIAAGEFLQLVQKIEGQNLQRIGKGVVGAQQITVSFYVKASAAFDFVCELSDLDNARQISKLFATTTDWVRHELTYAADVDDGSSPFDDDNAASLNLTFWLHAGTTYTSGTLNTATFANTTSANRAAGIDSFFSSTNNTLSFTGVQMEVGPVATEFEQEDIGFTLSKCQRYCQRHPAQDQLDDGTYTLLANCMVASTSEIVGQLPLPVTMREEPTASFSGSFRVLRQATSQAVTSGPTIIDGYSSASSVGLNATTGASLTVGQAGVLTLNNDVDAHMILDSEL